MSQIMTADRPQRTFTRLVILPNKYLVDKKELSPFDCQVFLLDTLCYL